MFEIFIWNFAGKDLIKDHPIGEHITHLVDIGLHTLRNLRGHPVIGSLLSGLGCLGEGAGCTKVTNFCKQARSKKNVSALQVTMNDVVAVEMFVAFH